MIIIIDGNSRCIMKRTETYEEIKPLIDLCKTGKLFEVQEWIASGKPVNPPPPKKGTSQKRPIQVAIDRGFHSLVKVLLEAGASTQERNYNALQQAVYMKRLDLIKLLVQHGAAIHSVEMYSVFDTWQPDIMDYFIENGADVDTDYPLAAALTERIRTALGVFKRYKDRFPTFQHQVNIALRHHCKEGNLKWVSLMLWAGGDPYYSGPDFPDEDPDPYEEGLNALEYAALYEHFEIFKLKQIRLDPQRDKDQNLIRMVCNSGNSKLLKDLLDKGFDPSDREGGESRLIQDIIQGMGGAFDLDFYLSRQKKDIDTERTREKIKIIHMLAKRGARWSPADHSEIAEARRSFLRMSPDYTVEFVWIMSKYNACKREDIEELIRTPSIKSLISENQPRIKELMEEFQTNRVEGDL